ncbi:amidohydrolase family protein [Komagataeibacter oboediens]|uniref:Amidohydrolase family protein n=2 Tax=Komagataeibacter oboediens TaxID=65958 RepID=A0ABS5SJ35_9PROT|nr:amidohydrolase family protein [Komagataeibacter oboediens]MBT0673839.1 amidohydrolase family protein [Komagataeibacter oboediens]MBT0677438.1 amidohydrolase family protein [Komagataeibacter oboediens]
MGMRHGHGRDLLLIRGGMVVTGQASLRVDVLCGGADGILAIGPDLDIPAGCAVVDAGGLLVMPGGVDAHTAIGADEAGFACTMDALSGGTTTILDTMCPGNDGLDAAWRAWRHAARRSHVDVGLHMALPDAGEAVLDGMDALVMDRGVNTFHLSMAAGLSDRAILKLSRHATDCGALCRIAAQNAQAVAYLRAELDQAGITGGEACLLSAPPQVEAEAVDRAIMLAGLVGAPVHVGPVSTTGATEGLARARLRGQRVEGHVLAPHLVVDEAVYDPEGDRAGEPDPYLTLPPFRDVAHRRALWGAVASGNIGMVASGFRAAGMGGDGLVDGLAQRMRVVWRHGVQAGVLTAEEFVAVTSQAAARAFNIYPRKGAIMPGADADIVLWDGGAEETCPAAPSALYAGITLGGRAVQVIRGGVTVWKDNRPYAAARRGSYVPCPAFRPALSARMRRAAHLSTRDGEP